LIRIGLCEINVQGNNISDEGVKDIIDFLKHDSWLRSLNLRDNGITKIGIVEFIKVLTQNESLLSLDLRGNPGFNRKAS
jgi:Ran GTPase-activating protein (RanGAP) involved in mRNA processing and transport